MLFSLSGTVKHIGATFVVIEAGGVGYQVFATPSTLSLIRANGSMTLWIFHVITEGSQALYGFTSLEERSFFESLLTVSGVGGKTAINIMGLAPVDDLEAAIRSGDPSMLTRVAGVGKRTAERIVVELKEKLGSGDTLSSSHGDAFDALLGLGYNATDVRRALRDMPSTTTNTETILKEALKKLGGSQH